MNCTATVDYSYTIHHGHVSTIDHDPADGVSVTNDAAAVLAEIASQESIDLDQHLITYCDSEGRWDGMHTKLGKFAGFFPLDQKVSSPRFP